ncbi:MAG: ABA4-like family protein [Bacteroidota bacterium]
MEPAVIFSICNSFVLIGWILLIFAPNWKHTLTLAVPIVIGILSLVYAFLILPTILHFDPSAFSSLANVKALFQDDRALTAGWVHYLAFDLLVGMYIVEKSKTLGIPRWQYTICLPFTFMFGPIGLLLFHLFKLIKK